VADPQGRLHALRRPGLPEGLPSPGAIIQYANGIVDFHEENCIGCGYCVTGCPFNVPRISQKDNKAYKCTLCSDRVAVGQEPACVKTCPTGPSCSAPRRP
jgi:formate dehydrogenase iron-sulfur subunit